eukprot:scaffold217990_cov24-Tisochrysis_lutea.AAC.1
MAARRKELRGARAGQGRRGARAGQWRGRAEAGRAGQGRAGREQLDHRSAQSVRETGHGADLGRISSG